MSTVSLKQTEFGVQGTTSLLGVLKLFLVVTLVTTSIAALSWGYLAFRDWRRAAPRREYIRNAEVVKALTGKNSQLLAIIPTRLQQNAKGQFIDAWGTPLQIYLAGNDVLIRSAGPNLVFDDARAEENDDVLLAN